MRPPLPALRLLLAVGVVLLGAPVALLAAELPPELVLALPQARELRLVLIPAGRFVMGAPAGEADRAANEGPQHEVTISEPFYLSACTVTQEQYAAVTGRNPSRYPGPTLPIQVMTWADIADFCARLGAASGRRVRVPTEAEWEYACRAGTRTTWFFGDRPEGGDAYGWFDGVQPHPVGQKKPNPWGLYDMCGNVAQVCSDLGARYPKETLAYPGPDPVTDPTGPGVGDQHVVRGQWGWIGHSRSAGNRSAFAHPDYRDHLFSFRVVVAAP